MFYKDYFIILYLNQGGFLEKVLDIINSIANEKGLEKQKVTEAIQSAFSNTAKIIIDRNTRFDAIINEEQKTMEVFQVFEVVDENDERLDDADEVDINSLITLNEAKKIDESLEIGDEYGQLIDLKEHGRHAFILLNNQIDHKVNLLVQEKIYDKYKRRLHKLVSSNVAYIDTRENIFVEIEEIRAILPKKFQMQGDVFKVGQEVRAVIQYVDMGKNGIKVELSRTSPKFLEALMHREVPEIQDNNVLIEASARIPGKRAKVSLISTRENIDAVGAAVGVKGARINAVSNELLGESIDIINHSNVNEVYISRAMAPAIVNHVKIEGQKAIVALDIDQKSKAIGKAGVNIRLASMLTKYDIEIVEVSKDENSKIQEAQKVSSLFK